MDGVDEPETLRFRGIFTVVVGVAEESWRHAWPQSENDKGNEVAHRHRASTRLIKGRTSAIVVVDDSAGHGMALAGCREVVEHDEEEDSSGDMDEGIDPVDPMEQSRMLEEPVLDGKFPEDL